MPKNQNVEASHRWLRVRCDALARTGSEFRFLLAEVLVRVVDRHAPGDPYRFVKFGPDGSVETVVEGPACRECRNLWPCVTAKEIASLFADEEGYDHYWC